MLEGFRVSMISPTGVCVCFFNTLKGLRVLLFLYNKYSSDVPQVVLLSTAVIIELCRGIVALLSRHCDVGGLAGEHDTAKMFCFSEKKYLGRASE